MQAANKFFHQNFIKSGQNFKIMPAYLNYLKFHFIKVALFSIYGIAIQRK